MRTHETKQDGLLADYGGNIERHGPIEDIQPPKKESGKARKKTCPECGEKHGASVKQCKHCDYVFCRTCPTCDMATPMTESSCTNCGHEFFSERFVELAQTAARGLDVVSATVKVPEWQEVDRVEVRRHVGRNGKPDTLRVDYVCGLSAYPEWLGSAKMSRYYSDALKTPPASIEEALSGEVPKPTKIMVRKRGKYFDVIGRIF